MRKAWSFFWLVVASVVALVIIISLIEPYLWLIGLVIVVVVAAIIATKVWRSRSFGRRHF